MHIADTKIVAKIPKAKPQNLKAMGIDRIPVPKDAFSRCVNVPQSLKQYKTNYKKNCINQIIHTISKEIIIFI